MYYENTMWCLVLRRRSMENEARILDGYLFRQACNLENKMVLSCAWISTHPQPFVIPSPSHKTAAMFVLSVIPIRTHYSIIHNNSPVRTGMGQEDMTTTQCKMLLFLRWGTERRTITQFCTYRHGAGGYDNNTVQNAVVSAVRNRAENDHKVLCVQAWGRSIWQQHSAQRCCFCGEEQSGERSQEHSLEKISC